TDEVYKSKDKAMMLLTSLPPSYKYFRMTLMFGKGTLKYEEVMQDILMHHRIVQCLRDVSQDEGLVGKLGENDRSSKCEAKKSNRVSSSDYILDSGCSYVICSNQSWFDTYEVDDSGEVVIGDGLVCRVEGTSIIKVKMYDNIVRTLGMVSAYALTPSDEKTKLKPKSLERIVLSFESGVKGFKLWDPVNRKRILNSDYAC
ncbi:unnamed protein product, partial [Prunus brigantina]